MSEEHTDNLKKARARLIEQRRAFVKVLAGPYERSKTEQARERFLEMQTAIEAMDRAIEDEEGFAARRPRSLWSRLAATPHRNNLMVARRLQYIGRSLAPKRPLASITDGCLMGQLVGVARALVPRAQSFQ